MADQELDFDDDGVAGWASRIRESLQTETMGDEEFGEDFDGQTYHPLPATVEQTVRLDYRQSTSSTGHSVRKHGTDLLAKKTSSSHPIPSQEDL